jgi:hypothetical protein
MGCRRLWVLRLLQETYPRTFDSHCQLIHPPLQAEPARRSTLYRGVRSPTCARDTGGAGLSLAIVESHEGRVTARRNDPAPGTTFTICLPILPGEAGSGNAFSGFDR